MTENTRNDFMINIGRLHTTELGVVRIKRNLSLEDIDVVEWCKQKAEQSDSSVVRRGKNWYIRVDGCEITVNAYSFTIITAHKIKKKNLSRGVCFREMQSEDLELFQQWLSVPHVSKWYHHPVDWIEEVEKQETEFHWIHHYIVECDGKDIGFCQYYACQDSDELWEGYTALGGSYSIDYMIGEPDYIRKGFGREIVMELVERIGAHPDARRVVVQPEQENQASCGVLLACDFVYDRKSDIYVKEL